MSPTPNASAGGTAPLAAPSPAIGVSQAPRRLVDTLVQAQGRRCIVLTGPAGSGKTLLLQSWAARLDSQGIPVIRVGHAGPGQLGLVSTLMRRCLELDPAIASSLPVPFPDDPGQAISYLSVALVRALSSSRKQIVLIFDELHTQGHTRELRSLQPLLDYCPAGLQYVFAGREPPPLFLGRLRAYGGVLELDAGDLCWTLEDTQQWVRQQSPAIPDALCADWHAASGGWCAGLHFLLRRHQHGEGTAEQAPVPLPGEARAYLQHEVLGGLADADEVRQLARLSLLDDIDAEFCSALCTMAMHDSVAMLERWRARTGFVASAMGPRGATQWRILSPLQPLLAQHFTQLDSAAQARAHGAACREYARRGQRVRAVAHAVAAGDVSLAADLAERYADELFQIGAWRPLAELMGQLPAGCVQERPALRLWRAVLALLQHRDGECRRELDSLANAMAGFDLRAQYLVLVVRGLLAVRSDDMDMAMQLYPQLQAAPAQAEDIALAGGRNVLAWIHIYRNEYALARAVQQNPARGRAPMTTPFGVLTGRCMVGFSLALEGQMNAAEHLYRDVLYECGKIGDSASEAATLASGLLCEVLYELGNLDEVLSLRGQLREFERLSLPDTMLRVMLVLSRTLALRQQFDEALAIMRRLDRYARERKLDRLLSYSLLEQFRLHLIGASADQAAACWDEIRALRARHAQVESSVLSEVSVVADRADILLCLHEQRLDDARGKIQALIDVCAQRGRNRRVAALYFQLAAIHRATGDLPGAHQHTVRALRIGQQLGLVRSLLDAHPDVPELAALALESCTLDALLVFHADRLRAAAGSGPLAQAAIGGMDGADAASAAPTPPEGQLTDREREVVRLLALALPNKKIARELGLSPETVKWHLSNIYSKLGVATRDEVVARMRE